MKEKVATISGHGVQALWQCGPYQKQVIAEERGCFCECSKCWNNVILKTGYNVKLSDHTTGPRFRQNLHCIYDVSMGCLNILQTYMIYI